MASEPTTNASPAKGSEDQEQLATHQDIKELKAALRKTHHDVDYMQTVCTPPTGTEVQRAAADAVRGDLSSAGVQPDFANLHTLKTAPEPASQDSPPPAQQDSDPAADPAGAGTQRSPGRGWVRGAAQVLQALSDATNETAAEYDERMSHPASSPTAGSGSLRRKGSARAGAPGVLEPLPDHRADTTRKDTPAAGAGSEQGAAASETTATETREERLRRKRKERRKKKKAAQAEVQAGDAANAGPDAAAAVAAAAAAAPADAGEGSSVESRASSQSIDLDTSSMPQDTNPVTPADIEITTAAAPIVTRFATGASPQKFHTKPKGRWHATPPGSQAESPMSATAPPATEITPSQPTPLTSDTLGMLSATAQPGAGGDTGAVMGGEQGGDSGASGLRGLVSLAHDPQLFALSAPTSAVDAALAAGCAAADAAITSSATSEPLMRVGGGAGAGANNNDAHTHPPSPLRTTDTNIPALPMSPVTVPPAPTTPSPVPPETAATTAPAVVPPASPGLPSPFDNTTSGLTHGPTDSPAQLSSAPSIASHPVCITPANTAVTNELGYPSRQDTDGVLNAMGGGAGMQPVPVHIAAAAVLAGAAGAADATPPMSAATSGSGDAAAGVADRPATVDVSAIEAAGQQRAAEGGAAYKARAAAQGVTDTLVELGEKAAGLVALADKSGVPVSDMVPLPGLHATSPPPHTQAAPAPEGVLVLDKPLDTGVVGAASGGEERLEDILEYAGEAVSKAGLVVKDVLSAAAGAVKEAASGLVGATQDAVQEAKATLGGTGPLEGTRTPEATPTPPDTTHTTTATPVQDTLSKALDVAAAAVTQLVKSSEDVVDYMSEVPEPGNPYHIPPDERTPSTLTTTNTTDTTTAATHDGRTTPEALLGPVPHGTAPVIRPPPHAATETTSASAPTTDMHGTDVGVGEGAGEGVRKGEGEGEPLATRSVGQAVRDGLGRMGEQVRDAVVGKVGWLDVPMEIRETLTPTNPPAATPSNPPKPTPTRTTEVALQTEVGGGDGPDADAQPGKGEGSAAEPVHAGTQGGGPPVPAAWLSEIDEAVANTPTLTTNTGHDGQDKSHTLTDASVAPTADVSTPAGDDDGDGSAVSPPPAVAQAAEVVDRLPREAVTGLEPAGVGSGAGAMGTGPSTTHGDMDVDMGDVGVGRQEAVLSKQESESAMPRFGSLFSAMQRAVSGSAGRQF